MERNDMIDKIREDEDFINAPKHGNSLSKLLSRVEEPLENNAIGRALLLSESEVEVLYQESVKMLKKEMNPDE